MLRFVFSHHWRRVWLQSGMRNMHPSSVSTNSSATASSFSSVTSPSSASSVSSLSSASSTSASSASSASSTNAQTPTRTVRQSTVDQAEIAKFVRMASEWWDLDGKFAPLHAQNPTRVQFIREHIVSHFKQTDIAQPLKGLKIADIGCGGGLLSEPLARLGGSVTGIDAAPENVGVADAHRRLDPILCQPGRLQYRAITAEDLLAAEGEAQFDVICAMEIIEHVSDVLTFVQSVTKLLKPGGLLFLSTMNRTYKSYAMAIVGAEHILRWLPVGTHDWHKFLTPSEITAHLQLAGAHVREIKGIVLDPFGLPPLASWTLSVSDLDVNYAVCAVKPVEQQDANSNQPPVL